MFNIKFRCFSCSHTFDQSEQKYKGIRVIGKKVVCPRCNINLKVSDDTNDLDKKLNILGLVAVAFFVGHWIYISLVEETKFSGYFIFIPALIILIIKIRNATQRKDKIEKGEYYILKTEPYIKI